MPNRTKKLLQSQQVFESSLMLYWRLCGDLVCSLGLPRSLFEPASIATASLVRNHLVFY